MTFEVTILILKPKFPTIINLQMKFMYTMVKVFHKFNKYSSHGHEFEGYTNKVNNCILAVYIFTLCNHHGQSWILSDGTMKALAINPVKGNSKFSGVVLL